MSHNEWGSGTYDENVSVEFATRLTAIEGYLAGDRDDAIVELGRLQDELAHVRAFSCEHGSFLPRHYDEAYKLGLVKHKRPERSDDQP